MPHHLHSISYEMGTKTPLSHLQYHSPEETEKAHELGHRNFCQYYGTEEQILEQCLKTMLIKNPEMKSKIDFAITNIDHSEFNFESVLVRVGLADIPTLVVRGGQCNDGILAINAARGLLSIGAASYVLITSVSLVRDGSRFLYGGQSLLSDAASCAIVSNESIGRRIIDVSHLTSTGINYNSMADIIESFLPIVSNTWCMIKDSLNNLPSDPLYITVNSGSAAEFIGAMIGVSGDKFFRDNISIQGHAMCCDYFVNLNDLDDVGGGSDQPVVVMGLGQRSAACLLLSSSITD